VEALESCDKIVLPSEFLIACGAHLHSDAAAETGLGDVRLRHLD
jgi:hypothetical protein